MHQPPAETRAPPFTKENARAMQARSREAMRLKSRVNFARRQKLPGKQALVALVQDMDRRLQLIEEQRAQPGRPRKDGTPTGSPRKPAKSPIHSEPPTIARPAPPAQEIPSTTPAGDRGGGA